MDFFRFLQIEPTNDKNIIKKAYMQLLPQYHPEEDKEGFIQLRQAYEGALQWQPQTDTAETEEDRILQQAKELYQDFARRIDIEQWRVLLQAEVCNQIDTQWVVAQKILDFLQDNFYLPNEVIELLVVHFCLEERQDELERIFHPNFVHFILNAKDWNEWIRFEYFTVEEGKDYDQFLEIAYSINGFFNENNMEKVKESLDQLDALGITHLDVEIYKVRYYLAIDEGEKAEAVASALVEEYPGNVSALYAFGQVSLKIKDYERAKEIFTQLSEESPGVGTRRGLGEACFGLGEYVEAKDLFYSILTEFPYDYGVAEYFYRTNEALVNYYSDQEATEETIFLLAKAHYNTKNYQECLSLLEKVNPANVDAKKYYSLKMECYYQDGNYQPILDQIDALEGEDKDVFYALALFGVHDYDKAMAHIHEALDRYPESYRILLVKSDILVEQQQYEALLEWIDQTVALTNYKLPFLISKTKALYALQHYAEAIETGDEALQIYPYLVDIFVTKAKIYNAVEDYESCLDICNEAIARGLEDRELSFYKAVALRYQDQYEEALTILEPLGEGEPQEGRVFYELAYDYMELRRQEESIQAIQKAMALEKEDVYHCILAGYIYHRFGESEKALEIYKNALALKKRQEELYYRMGIIYTDLKKREDAIECYEKSIEMDPSYASSFAGLGDLFREEGAQEKAIGYYEKAIALYENPSFFVRKGICHSELNQYELALADYDRALEADPEYLWARNCLAYLHYTQGYYDQALEQYLFVYEKDPFYEVAMRNLANTYKKLNEQEKALALYDELIEKYKDLSAIRDMKFRKAKDLTILKRYGESIPLLEELQKEEPKNPDFAEQLIIAYEQTGELKKAEKVLKKALKWEPKDTALLYLQIEILVFGHNKYRTGLKYGKRLLEIDPNHHNTWSLMGKCALALKKKEAKGYFEKAKEILEEEIEKDPNWVCGKTFLAETLFYLGHISEAQEMYDRILEKEWVARFCFRPLCFEAYFGLCLIAEQKGDIQSAMAFCQKAIDICPDLEYTAKKRQLEKK